MRRLKQAKSSTSTPPSEGDPAMLKIPREINERILIMSDPAAVASVAQSCTFFHKLINRPVDQHLWRSIYLSTFEDPRFSFSLNGGDSSHFPWAREFQRRYHSKAILRSRRRFDTFDPKLQALVFNTLAHAVMISPPATHRLISHDLEWVKHMVGSGDVLQSRCAEEALQGQALLRIYFDLTSEHVDPRKAEAMRVWSRAYVYDLRRYTENNLYGPFLWNSEGRVSWIHVEHIYRVMAMNVAEILELFADMIPPTGLNAVRAYSAPLVNPLSTTDWAGVEGIWYRYVCFMDYRDLYKYNFSKPVKNTEPLCTAMFEDPNFSEAIRLIELKLEISGSYPSPRHPHRPILKFVGSSKGAAGNEAKVKGVVFMTPDNFVRWKFVSVYDGRTQWGSEGIQVGGAGSGFGVLGVWTGVKHLYQDPVGPFWLWRVDPELIRARRGH